VGSKTISDKDTRGKFKFQDRSKTFRNRFRYPVVDAASHKVVARQAQQGFPPHDAHNIQISQATTNRVNTCKNQEGKGRLSTLRERRNQFASSSELQMLRNSDYRTIGKSISALSCREAQLSRIQGNLK